MLSPASTRASVAACCVPRARGLALGYMLSPASTRASPGGEAEFFTFSSVVGIFIVGMLKSQRSLGAVVCKLHIDVEVSFFQERDDFLKGVSIFAAYPNKVSVDRGLHLEL